jgi:hypothetical protein
MASSSHCREQRQPRQDKTGVFPCLCTRRHEPYVGISLNHHASAPPSRAISPPPPASPQFPCRRQCPSFQRAQTEQTAAPPGAAAGDSGGVGGGGLFARACLENGWGAGHLPKRFETAAADRTTQAASMGLVEAGEGPAAPSRRRTSVSRSPKWKERWQPPKSMLSCCMPRTGTHST